MRTLTYLVLLGTASVLVSGQRSQFNTIPTRTGTIPTRAGTIPVRADLVQYADGHNLTFVISASDIPNTGLVSNVSPYVKVYYTNRTQAEPIKFATTDVVKKDPTPEFTTVVSFVWNKGMGQKLLFKVKSDSFGRDDTLGEATVDVDDYVINKGQKVNVSLSNGGSLLVQKTTPTRFRLYARDLPRMDAFNTKSDPFVKAFWRRGSNGGELQFAQTQYKSDLENVDWDETIEFANYIKGTDLWWVFKVRDHDGVGSDDDLGEALVEIDPYVAARQTKKVRLGSTGKAYLYITPM